MKIEFTERHSNYSGGYTCLECRGLVSYFDREKHVKWHQEMWPERNYTMAGESDEHAGS